MIEILVFLFVALIILAVAIYGIRLFPADAKLQGLLSLIAVAIFLLFAFYILFGFMGYADLPMHHRYR